MGHVYDESILSSAENDGSFVRKSFFLFLSFIKKILNDPNSDKDGINDVAADRNGVIDVPFSMLFLSTLPLFGLAYISWSMDWRLESPLIVGIMRTIIQLLVLGAILRPIFVWGVHMVWVVLLYLFLITVMASFEASTRPKYYYDYMFLSTFAAISINVGIVAIVTFGVIVRPDPVWDPQYVIPITGMILGNCVSGVGLASNALLGSLVEQPHEVELYLSFGANANEASSRLVREAVRVGAMPMLNSMRVIGIISIPGMMTGQILAGSNPFEAAKYQILIMQLISICAFGTIFIQIWMERRMCLDPCTGMLRTQTCLHQQPVLDSFLETMAVTWNGFVAQINSKLRWPRKWCCSIKTKSGFHYAQGSRESDSLLHRRNHSGAFDDQIESALRQSRNSTSSVANGHEFVAPSGMLEIMSVKKGSKQSNFEVAAEGIEAAEQQGKKNNNDVEPVLELFGISRSFKSVEIDDDGRETAVDRTLFRDVSLQAHAGDVFAVCGPSGVGKSQLLRVMGALSPADEDVMTQHNVNDSILNEEGAGLVDQKISKRHLNNSDMRLRGTSFREWNRGNSACSAAQWRRQVRYVSQYKVDIIGTPRDFLKKVADFESWKKQVALDKEAELSSSQKLDTEQGQGKKASRQVPTTSEMQSTTIKLIQLWGLEASSLDKQWKVLSGGESQRMYLAIAIASQPRVLLLDESTSALDNDSKRRVEKSVERIASEGKMCVVWVTHDQEQLQRLGGESLQKVHPK